MGPKDNDSTVILEMLSDMGGLQEAVDGLAPMVSLALPPLFVTTITAIDKILNPVIGELVNLAGSKELKTTLGDLVELKASLRRTVHEAGLSQSVRESVAAEAKLKAMNAKAQLEAFKAAGFTKTEAIDLLKQIVIADAIRYARPSSPFPELPSFGKKKTKKKTKPTKA